jgi:hypothetical protein
MSSQNFSAFSVVLLVLGSPEHSSSSTDTQPTLKHECHSKIAVRLKKRSPKASQCISWVLVADLVSFTQNLMQTCCSILLSITDKSKSIRVKTMHVHSTVSCGRLMQ